MAALPTHTLLAAQSHRRVIDPITFAKRRKPFVIERAPNASGASPAPSTSTSAPAVEVGRGANRRGRG